MGSSKRSRRTISCLLKDSSLSALLIISSTEQLFLITGRFHVFKSSSIVHKNLRFNTHHVLDIQSNPVKIHKASSDLLNTRVIVFHHKEPLQTKPYSYPRVHDPPGIIQHMRAHGRRADFYVFNYHVERLPIYLTWLPDCLVLLYANRLHY